MPAEASERRSSPRWPVELHVEFRHLGRPGESWNQVIRDLSEGGVFVESTVLLEPGTAVELAVSAPPGRPPIVLHGKVVRVEQEARRTGSAETARARGMAVAFDDGQESAVNRLVEFAGQRGKETQDGTTIVH